MAYMFAGCTSLVVPPQLDNLDFTYFMQYANGSDILPLSSSCMGMFQNCTSFESITIPLNVGSIGECAFKGCTNLATVYCKPATPPSVYGDSFEGTDPNLKIYVPAASVDSYKDQECYWYYYKDIIEGATNF